MCMKSNRAFEEMIIHARKRLEEKSPAEIAEKSGSEYDPKNGRLKIKSLAEQISLVLPEYSFVQEVEEWHQLVILHYLDLADHTPVSEEQITFGELKDGLIRGTKFDHDMERALAIFLKGKSEEQLCQIIKACGGEIIDSKADICAKFDFLPYYPLWLKIWLADDEFEASGKLLLSKSADHYLAVEDAVTVGGILMEKLRAVSDV